MSDYCRRRQSCLFEEVKKVRKAHASGAQRQIKMWVVWVYVAIYVKGHASILACIACRMHAQTPPQ